MYLNQLSTQRLTIRPLQIEDAKDWTAFFINNSNLKHLGLGEIDAKTAELYAKSWIEKQIWRYQNNEYGHHALVLKETGKLVGQCGLLTQVFGDQKEIEVGYHMLPQYMQNGYATEAALAVRDFAFENNIAESLISLIGIDNEPAQKVAKKLSMKKDSRMKANEMDVYIYQIDKEEWEELQK